MASHGALCPVLDTYNEIWLHPWNYGTPKTALVVLYGFQKLIWRYLYLETKVKTFWHCDDDPTVDPEITKAFIQQIKNAGGTAYMRSLPYGGHGPEEVGEVLTDPSGNTEYRGETLEIKPVTEEVFLWFNGFDSF